MTKFITTLFLLLSLTCLPLFGAFKPTVLIVAAENDQALLGDVKVKLEATGLFAKVDTFNSATQNLTFSRVIQYNSVLVYTNDDPLDANILGDTLAAYIEAGGGLVNSVFATASVKIEGRFAEKYQLMIPNNQEQNIQYTLGAIANASSPLVQGVTSFDGGSSSYRAVDPTLEPGAYVVAQWSDGDPLIVADTNIGPLRVARVDLNFFPPSSTARADFWDASTDGALIMGNALVYVSKNVDLTLPPVLVLAAADPSYLVDVKHKLDSIGFFSVVDTFDMSSKNISLEKLNAFKSVLVFTDIDPFDNTVLGDSLAAYIDNGGGVVNAVFSTASMPIGGRFETDFQLIVASGQTDGQLTMGTFDNTSVLMDQVATFDGGGSSYRNDNPTLSSGCTVVAQWSDGQPLVVSKSNLGLKNVKRVDLNFYPPSSDVRSDFWTASTDGSRIIANALLYAGPEETIVTSVVTSSNEFTSSVIYPNPTAGAFSIRLNTPVTESVSLQLINSMGIVMGNISIAANVDHVVVSQDLPKGLYTIQAKAGVALGKVVVE